MQTQSLNLKDAPEKALGKIVHGTEIITCSNEFVLLSILLINAICLSI
jgi:hypothetical protein